MEESISSTRTAGASFLYRDVHGCYASGGPRVSPEASEDSGWTAYFYDDDDNYLQLQASEEEPAPGVPAPSKTKENQHGHGHGDRASASTVSTASRTKARKKKEVTKEGKKKRPRWEPADEDPLQDTASSLPTLQLQLLDGWQIAGCYDQQRSSDTELQWIDYCSLQETHMGLPGQARCRKEELASCLISPS